MRDPNLHLLEEAAGKLGPLLPEVVFLGGVTLGLLITDEASAPIRITTDVDIVAEIVTYADYVSFSERLRQLKFEEDAGEGAPACRWLHGRLTLDVLALREEVLGFTNRWYEGALNEAEEVLLPGGASIRVIRAPFFLGTKMEAFHGRGGLDFAASRDLEDFVAVVEGRSGIVEEIAETTPELRRYLSAAANGLLDESRFLDVLPGFVLDEGRVPLILERFRAIARL